MSKPLHRTESSKHVFGVSQNAVSYMQLTAKGREELGTRTHWEERRKWQKEPLGVLEFQLPSSLKV